MADQDLDPDPFEAPVSPEQSDIDYSDLICGPVTPWVSHENEEENQVTQFKMWARWPIWEREGFIFVRLTLLKLRLLNQDMAVWRFLSRIIKTSQDCRDKLRFCKFYFNLI